MIIKIPNKIIGMWKSYIATKKIKEAHKKYEDIVEHNHHKNFIWLLRIATKIQNFAQLF